MLFISIKKYFHPTIYNSGLRFFRNKINLKPKTVRNSFESAYEIVISFHNEKLQILESKHELMEKKRAVRHERAIEKLTPKLIKLKNCICNERSDLAIFGSISNGLVLHNNCKIDVSFVVLDDDSKDFENDFNYNINFKKFFVDKVIKLIKADKDLWNDKKDTLTIFNETNSPRINLNFEDNTKCSLQFSNYHKLKNTNVFRYYASSDPRFRKLYMYVKILLSNMDLLGGTKELLKSYHILYLVAHFLQMPFKNQKAVLPFIPEICSSYVSPDLSLREVVENLNKPADVSEIQPLINPDPLASHLVLQFIDYFANFEYERNSIKMNKYNPVYRHRPYSSVNAQIFNYYTNHHLIDSKQSLKMLSKSMEYAQKLMKNGLFIDSFPNIVDEEY